MSWQQAHGPLCALGGEWATCTHLAKAGTDEGPRDPEHFGHARGTLRALIADDNRITCLHLQCLDGIKGFRLRVKHLGGPDKPAQLLAGQLDNGRAGGKVAAQDADVGVGRRNWRREREDNVLQIHTVKFSPGIDVAGRRLFDTKERGASCRQGQGQQKLCVWQRQWEYVWQ